MNATDGTNIQAALRQLEEASGTHPAAAQRRFQRFAVRGEAWLVPKPVGSPQHDSTMVHVRDISRGGLGVLSEVKAKPGQFWQVCLGTDGIDSAVRPGFCRHCREAMPGLYLIGIEFGVEASVLLAMGVTGTEISRGDESEPAEITGGSFVIPDDVDGASQATDV